MEFWGVEVKSGEPLPVTPGEGMILHLSQANLGELKKEKANESICLFLKVDGKKLVLGTLFTEKLPQQQLDLVFDRDFELSHNWKNGSIFFYGYKASNPFEEDEFEDGESDDSDFEEAIPLTVSSNGNLEATVKQEKPAGPQKSDAVKNKGFNTGKQKVKIVEPNKDEGDDESTDEDLMSEEDDEDDTKDEDDSDNSDEDSDGSDEETPKKAEPSKKRAAESAAKTPVADKKAKATPQKTDSKKAGGHVATPHPAKQGGKVAANKPNQQTPKSVGSHACKSCNRRLILKTLWSPTVKLNIAVESNFVFCHPLGILQLFIITEKILVPIYFLWFANFKASGRLLGFVLCRDEWIILRYCSHIPCNSNLVG